LNVINPSYEKKSKSDPETLVDPNPRKQADDSRHLAKYVFQRQYGFSSPFTTGKASKLRDYSNLEEEIKASWLVRHSPYTLTTVYRIKARARLHKD